MPAKDAPAVIVARYLKSNDYLESYEAFIDEAGLERDVGDANKGDLTLETLLAEKKTFDISVNFEKLGVEDGTTGWSLPAPSIVQEVKTLPSVSNILSVTIATAEGDGIAFIAASTADRRLNTLDPKTDDLRTTLTIHHDSPVLSCALLSSGHLLTTSMSGQLLLNDLSGRELEKRTDHSKFVVKVTTLEHGGTTIIATAGWDSKICFYKVSTTATAPHIGEPFATISLPTKPEAIVLLLHPDTSKPILLVSRTDSSCMFYYTVEDSPRLIGQQNLAPHSNAWVAFTPSAIELCPIDPGLVAVATSSIPHMKVLIVRLMFPPWDIGAIAPPLAARARASLLDEGPATLTQASQARAALAIADREAAAIQIHCTTMAPQTAYSTPAVAWRPNGGGVWVNGDDGAVRGIETSTGKIIATLRGHEPGSKVRCLCAGFAGGDEIMVSGGFDQKLIVWRTGLTRA